MKKFISLLLIIFTIFSFASCTKKPTIIKKNIEPTKLDSYLPNVNVVNYYEHLEKAGIIRILNSDCQLLYPHNDIYKDFYKEFDAKANYTCSKKYYEKDFIRDQINPSSVGYIINAEISIIGHLINNTPIEKPLSVHINVLFKNDLENFNMISLYKNQSVKVESKDYSTFAQMKSFDDYIVKCSVTCDNDTFKKHEDDFLKITGLIFQKTT